MLPALVELLRRIVAAAGLLAGGWLVLQSGDSLFIARRVDFQQEFENALRFGPQSEVLNDFIRRRTAGRMIDATDTPWAAFVRAVHAGSLSGVPHHLTENASESVVVLERDALPRTIEGNDAKFAYLHLPGDGLWVSLSSQPAAEIRGVPPRWVHPSRGTGLILIGLALGTYAGLPRRRLRSAGLMYSRTGAVVLPDLLGLAIAVFFFALPIFVLGKAAPGQHPWSADGGWIWLTAISWSLATCGLALLAVGFRYATQEIVLTDEALIVARAFGSRRYPWHTMEACAPYRSSRGTVVGLLLILFARGPGMGGQGLLVASNAERGVEVRMRDGRRLCIMANAFPGYTQVIAALQRHGLEGAAALEP